MKDKLLEMCNKIVTACICIGNARRVGKAQEIPEHEKTVSDTLSEIKNALRESCLEDSDTTQQNIEKVLEQILLRLVEGKVRMNNEVRSILRDVAVLNDIVLRYEYNSWETGIQSVLDTHADIKDFLQYFPLVRVAKKISAASDVDECCQAEILEQIHSELTTYVCFWHEFTYGVFFADHVADAYVITQVYILHMEKVGYEYAWGWLKETVKNSVAYDMWLDAAIDCNRVDWIFLLFTLDSNDTEKLVKRCIDKKRWNAFEMISRKQNTHEKQISDKFLIDLCREEQWKTVEDIVNEYPFAFNVDSECVRTSSCDKHAWTYAWIDEETMYKCIDKAVLHQQLTLLRTCLDKVHNPEMERWYRLCYNVYENRFLQSSMIFLFNYQSPIEMRCPRFCANRNYYRYPLLQPILGSTNLEVLELFIGYFIERKDSTDYQTPIIYHNLLQGLQSSLHLDIKTQHQRFKLRKMVLESMSAFDHFRVQEYIDSSSQKQYSNRSRVNLSDGIFKQNQ